MTSEKSENLDELEYEFGNGEGGGADQDQSGMAGIEEDDASEFSRLGDGSDDPEQKQRYMEYLELIKEIDCQNRIIEGIKQQIKDLCGKPCKTRCEVKEIKRLRTCMETENLKLQCLMAKAMQLQNFGSRRRYHDLPIATTLDEDNMDPYKGCVMPVASGWKGAAPESSENEPQQGPCQDECKKDNPLRTLCDAVGKMKVCCPEDKKLIQDIVAALMCNKGKKKPCGRQEQPPCGGGRDGGGQRSSPCGSPCGARKSSHRQQQQQQPCGQADSLDKLKQKIMCMQSSVNKLRCEIQRREEEKICPSPCPCPCPEPEEESVECKEEPDPIVTCGGKRKGDQMQKLKDNYLYLLSEFAKKDCQLKELEQRLKGMCGSCNGQDGGKKADAEQSELKLLRVRVNELKEEQVEFKCIMKEQSTQLEDYRQKYLIAQQKVEEQTVTLDKLNMTNKRIEKQINTEIKEIRTKFQTKLQELLHFPKLLENEQLKLAQACKEKEDLQSKLILICKELKALKAQQEQPKDNGDCRHQLMKCQMEVTEKKSKIDELERQRDLFCEQLKNTQEDLDTLRCESAKIIARTKERAELIRAQQQEQINRMEKELAQCRATACLSVSDREAVIREMQGQLNTLSYSFDAAQKQIKTLRNHIAYVTNDNCFPMKC